VRKKKREGERKGRCAAGSWAEREGRGKRVGFWFFLTLFLLKPFKLKHFSKSKHYKPFSKHFKDF
jgi:hypothetical protein